MAWRRERSRHCVCASRHPPLSIRCGCLQRMPTPSTCSSTSSFRTLLRRPRCAVREMDTDPLSCAGKMRLEQAHTDTMPAQSIPAASPPSADSRLVTSASMSKEDGCSHPTAAMISDGRHRSYLAAATTRRRGDRVSPATVPAPPLPLGKAAFKIIEIALSARSR